MHTVEYVLTGEEAAVHGRRRVCAAVSGEVEFKANSRGGPHATVTGDWRLDDFSFPVRKSIIRSQYGRLPLRGCIYVQIQCCYYFFASLIFSQALSGAETGTWSMSSFPKVEVGEESPSDPVVTCIAGSFILTSLSEMDFSKYSDQ